MDDDIEVAVGDGLTPRQERFAVEYARTGNASEAARSAGYSARSAGQQGWMLLKNPQILARVSTEQAAMVAEQRARLSALANAALDSLAATLDEASPGSMARVKACELILDRAGHKPVERVSADVATVSLDDMDDEMAARVIQAARDRLNMGAVFIVPPAAPSIEAWAAEHAPKDPQQPA
ncbi:MAG: terminase small subunit [Acidithiobacillus sp.]